MTIVVFLFLLVGVDPLPTYMLIDQFADRKECKEHVEALQLPEADAAKLSCTAVVTSKFWNI